jgi:TetR/AcrR family transcriptional regulator, regulator of biofilm formation and stress response
LSTTEDGRRARGAARRRQLADAALIVIARDGIAGLTHRAVATQAGVSLALASYHFAGIDDLAATALTQASEDLRSALSADGDHSARRLARVLADEREHNRERLLAGYELALLAVRRPELRPQALAWLDAMADAFAPDLHGPARQALQATVEGVCLHTLLSDRAPEPDEIEAVLARAWPRQ